MFVFYKENLLVDYRLKKNYAYIQIILIESNNLVFMGELMFAKPLV